MHKDTTWLDLWEGFRVIDADLQTPGQAVLTLEPLQGSSKCSGCLKPLAQVHEYVQRTVRDMPLVDRQLRLKVKLHRLVCPDCGKCLQHVPWLDKYSRLTKRLVEHLQHLCQHMSIKHVAKTLGLHWQTVRELDARRLQQQIDSLPPAQPERLVMDEFAMFKGHRYASVILDADTRRVLYIAPGRSRKSLRPFFEALGKQGCQRIQAVAMDMNTAFDAEVKHWCPKAKVVYDLFHVVAKYGREVVARVRVDAANALRGDKRQRKMVKSVHWLLLKNEAHLRPEQKQHLQQVLQANQPLMTVYVLKDELKQLWNCSDPWQFRRSWRQWHEHCQQSGIACLQRFAKKLSKYWRGILSRVHWPMHTGLLEGINNRIKLIKRMAYGYRNTEYFFLKIKAAFPGNP